jgi:ABC-type transporter Mla MlaB component
MIDLNIGKKAARLKLSGVLEFEQLQPLLQAAQQIEAAGKPLILEWHALQSLHYACLQVLIALGKSLAMQGIPAQVKEPSPELYAQLQHYGLWNELLGATPS